MGDRGSRPSVAPWPPTVDRSGQRARDRPLHRAYRVVMASFASVEAYLAALPASTRAVVEQVRAAVLAELPDARERISYDILAFVVDDRIVLYLAGWKHHVSALSDPRRRPCVCRRHRALRRWSRHPEVPVDRTGPARPGRLDGAAAPQPDPRGGTVQRLTVTSASSTTSSRYGDARRSGTAPGAVTSRVWPRRPRHGQRQGPHRPAGAAPSGTRAPSTRSQTRSWPRVREEVWGSTSRVAR